MEIQPSDSYLMQLKPVVKKKHIALKYIVNTKAENKERSVHLKKLGIAN